MKWDEVAIILEAIAEQNLRNGKTEILSKLWQKVSSREAKILCYLAVGRVAPLYEPIEIGMAEKSLIRVISWVSKSPLDEVTKEYKRVGDLGEVVLGELGKLGGQKIGKSVTEVYEELYKLAMTVGTGSQESKVQILGKILSSVSPLGAKYIMRLVSGKMRLGLLDMTIIDSLSWAKKGDKQDRESLEHAYNVSSDLGLVAEVYLSEPSKLSNWCVVPGVPVRPMRAERLGTIEEIVAKLGECAVEPKLDGMRVQVHAFGRSAGQQTSRSTNQQVSLIEEEIDDVQVRIFSRGLEDITSMFPEVIGAARELFVKNGAFVIDGEALGVADDGSYLPFQETMKRKRKYGIAEKVDSTPLRVVVFDVLYAQGEDQLAESYIERRESLVRLKLNGVFSLAQSETVTTAERMHEIFAQAMKKKLEGILVKKLDSHYRAGARDSSWVKYKRAHESELSDTIDAVVIGAYVGKGKRNKFGVGAFLVGILSGEKIVTVAKIGTGLTDEQFGELYGKIQKYKDSSRSDLAGQDGNAPQGLTLNQYDVPKSLTPDIWVTQDIVVEIEADEITESPLHTAGYALRFPRLLRFRTDKLVSDITTLDEVVRLFEIGRGR